MKKKKHKKSGRSSFDFEIDQYYKENNKFKKFLYFLYIKLFKSRSIARQLLFWYLAFTFFGGLLLWTPFSLQEGVSISFVDAMFTSASAISDTGLTTLIVSETFNMFGQIIIFIQIIIGGIGWFAVKIYFINFLIFRKLKYSTYQQANERLGTVGTAQTKGIIKVSVISTIFIILIIGPLMGVFFATVQPISPDVVFLPDVDPSKLDPNLYGNWDMAMWTGYFMTASAINNAGFDILNGGFSLMAYYGNIGFQVLIMFLFIFGGIGFAAIYDIKEYFKYRNSGQRFKLSIATKISFIAYWAIAIFGLSFTFIGETSELLASPDLSFLGNPDNGYGDMGLRINSLFFNTFSTRNAGFSTIEISSLSVGTLFNFSILMFIGSGPGSTAGGIRTTTFAVLIISLWAYMRGKSEVVISKRKVSSQQVHDALMIFIFSILIIFLEIFVLSICEFGRLGSKTLSFMDLFFVSTSAFGTTGMSTFNLNQLADSSKICILIVMFIGQLGAGTTMRQFRSHKLEKIQKHHIEERVTF